MASNYGNIFLILGIIIVVVILIIFFCISKNNITFESYIKPKNKFKLNVIIPIRNRDKELDKITDHLDYIFSQQNIIAKYYIVEQNDGKKFNKGKISNAAFKEAIKDNFSQYYLFNDVDVFPRDEYLIDYRTPTDNIIKHQYGQKHCLGCFFLTTKQVYQKINGYSNNYWGWGGEDVDLHNRAKVHGIFIDRKGFIKRPNSIMDDDISASRVTGKKIEKTEHLKNQILKHKMNKSYKKNPNNTNKDGLNTCVYKILSTTVYKNDPNKLRMVVSI